MLVCSVVDQAPDHGKDPLCTRDVEGRSEVVVAEVRIGAVLEVLLEEVRLAPGNQWQQQEALLVVR